MALAATITAVDCVPVCDTLLELDDAQFYATLIDLLLTETGLSLSTITAAQLSTAVSTARCNLQDRVVFSTSSPMKQKAIIVYLAQQLA